MKAAGSGTRRQIARLVERAPDAGVAAPRAQPAESDQRRDACDHGGFRLGDHRMRGGRGLVPTRLLQQCVGEPRRLPQPRRIEVAFGAEVDALAQPGLGLGKPERVDAARSEAGENLAGESIFVGTERQRECTLECCDALVDPGQVELRAADRLQAHRHLGFVALTLGLVEHRRSPGRSPRRTRVRTGKATRRSCAPRAPRASRAGRRRASPPRAMPPQRRRCVRRKGR